MTPPGMSRNTLRTVICLSFCALALGAGCWQALPSSGPKPADIVIPSSTTPSGPKLLDTSGMSSAEVANNIKLVQASVIEMRQDVSGVDPAMLSKLSVGPGENTRDITIDRFAPGNLAQVDWKSQYTTQSVGKDGKTSDVNHQLVGTMGPAALLDSYSLYPPALWNQGDSDAYSTGMLWLSQDVYENLTRGGLSTYYFGLTEADVINALRLEPGSRLATAFTELKRQADDTINNGHLDVYLAKADPKTVQWQMTVNGKLTMVDAMKVSSWFGTFLVLKNPYYPLVLEVKTSDPVHAIFGTLFDYEVIELKDVDT